VDHVIRKGGRLGADRIPRPPRGGVRGQRWRTPDARTLSLQSAPCVVEGGLVGREPPRPSASAGDSSLDVTAGAPLAVQLTSMLDGDVAYGLDVAGVGPMRHGQSSRR
jgi:hypothetical protein